MPDQTANIVAWSAGVSAVSATLAGVLASRATTPLSHNPWFMLCIVVAIVSFAILLLVGPRLVWTWWRDRHEPADPPNALASERGALPAAAESAVPAVNPDEFRPHHQESGKFPDSKALTFGFDHITDHPAAYMALNPRRCTVATPSGVTVSATKLNRYFQYPQEFENAPPVRPGLYRFQLEGQLRNGEWVFITSGQHEVRGPKLVVTIMEDSRFENWRYIALIAALHVKVENTTDTPILIGGYAYTYVPQEGPAWDFIATGEESMSIRREIYQRDKTQYYGQPLRNFARIVAHETISGWFLVAVNRPPAGGTPACTVIVKNDVRNEYRATFPAREPQVYGS